jgi:hypothetical protein
MQETQLAGLLAKGIIQLQIPALVTMGTQQLVMLQAVPMLMQLVVEVTQLAQAQLELVALSKRPFLAQLRQGAVMQKLLLLMLKA